MFSKNNTMKSSIVAMFIVLATVGNLQAQTDDDGIAGLSLSQILNLDVITVSKKVQKSSDAPATIYVVTRQTIENRGYRNLQDLLEDIPEVEIQKKSSSEFSNYYTLRGVGGNEKFVILLDDVRINSTTGTPHVVGANYALTNVKRVEVILGPASALYGVDAFSGIINIITNTGAKIDGGKLTSSYGRFGTTDYGFVYGKKFGEEASFALTANFSQSNEPKLADYYRDDYAWYHSQYKTQGLVRLAPFSPDVIFPVKVEEYETPSEASFIHSALNFKDFEFAYHRNSESHNTSVGGLPDFNIYTKNAVYKIAIQSLSGKHKWQSENDKWHLHSSISYGSYKLDPKSKFVNTFSGYNDAFKFASSRSTKVEEQLNFNPTTNHSLIAGFLYEDISALPKSGDLPKKFDPNQAADVQQIYYIGTDFTDRNGNDLTIFQDFFYLEYQNYGAFLQYQGKLQKNLELTAGGRFDNNTRYGSSFNPRLGLVFSPLEKTKLKALYGEAFLAPSPYKAYQHYGAFITVNDNGDFTTDENEIAGLFGPFWHLPNPDLKPEQLRSYELSASHYLGENLVVSGNAYLTRISDLITVDGAPNQEFKGVPVGFAEIPVNSGLAILKGGTAKLDALLKIGEANVTAYAAYSYSAGKIEDDNGAIIRNNVPFSAKHTLKSGMEVTYGKLSFSPRLIMRSKSFHPILQDDSGDFLTNESYTVFNLYARYSNLVTNGQFNASLFLRVENATDKRYYNISPEGGSFFPQTPQDPRRISAGITLAF